MVEILIVAAYLTILLGLGFHASRRMRRTSEDYFVASRSLSPILLFLTMAATNFSALTVFGFSGSGWSFGYAFYPVIAFGTGFMAVMFLVIGLPVWQLGREHGWVTPPEMIMARWRNPWLRGVFLAVMIIFTLPYLAMQPMAAGYALEGLVGIPYFAGAALMTAVMLLYTYFGGLRGVAWTDALQGGMLIVSLMAALVCVAGAHGGMAQANRAAFEAFPELFSRPGAGGIYTPGIWLGYLLLWMWADPMFPQLFQRFYAARSRRAIRTTAVLYPILTGFLFLLPVSIGVVGRVALPELPVGKAADEILPLLLTTHAPRWIAALVLTSALAALMSTLDSQLLSLSSILTRDLLQPALAGSERFQSDRARFWMGKLAVVVLAVAGLAIAWRPPASFLRIATQAFTGLAVLFPTVIATLYSRRATAAGCLASILVGEGLVGATYFGAFAGLGTLPVVPIVLASGCVLAFVSAITQRPASKSQPIRGLPVAIRKRALWWMVPLGILFFLANDFWAWGDSRPGWLGYPQWLWRSFGLCLLAAAVFAFSSKRTAGET
ncbi:sodium:solute symporter family protein [Candidatus Bipolaricaulota bacterium]|nr:sodium:solute symporter family protein [Candidatus Bipolaricaulota bacterium]